jgi:hypothetical protein
LMRDCCSKIFNLRESPHTLDDVASIGCSADDGAGWEGLCSWDLQPCRQKEALVLQNDTFSK